MNTKDLVSATRDTLPRMLPGVQRIIYNKPATIVFWTDGTKTVVRCGAGEKYEHYAGFCAAVVKKLFGSTSAAKRGIVRMESRGADFADEYVQALGSVSSEAFIPMLLGDISGLSVMESELDLSSLMRDADGPCEGRASCGLCH